MLIRRCRVISVSASGSSSPRRIQARHTPTASPDTSAKAQQYPNENEGIYDQVADVVAQRGNVLLERHIGLIWDLRQYVSARSGSAGDRVTATKGPDLLTMAPGNFPNASACCLEIAQVG